MGHIARVCPSISPRDQGRPLKRHAEQEEAVVERKVAAIECAKTEAEFNTKVRENDEDIE